MKVSFLVSALFHTSVYAATCEEVARDILKLHNAKIEGSDKHSLTKEELQRIKKSQEEKIGNHQFWSNLKMQSYYSAFEEDPANTNKESLEAIVYSIEKHYNGKSDFNVIKRQAKEVLIQKINEYQRKLTNGSSSMSYPFESPKRPYFIPEHVDVRGASFYKDNFPAPGYGQENERTGKITIIQRNSNNVPVLVSILPTSKDGVLQGNDFRLVKIGNDCFVKTKSVRSGIFTPRDILMADVNQEVCQKLAAVAQKNGSAKEYRDAIFPAPPVDDFISIDSYFKFSEVDVKPYLLLCNSIGKYLLTRSQYDEEEKKEEDFYLSKQCESMQAISKNKNGAKVKVE